MAKVTRKLWTATGPTGRRVKRVAWGYTLMVHGTREKRFDSAWQSEAEALAALTARLQEVEAGRLERPADRTLAQVAEEYLRYKERTGKRSLEDDERILATRLLPALGADLPVRKVTAAAIAQYERTRLDTLARHGQRTVSPSTVCNELSILRHVLRLARRWGYLEQVPEIVLPRKPEGRLRYLTEEEIPRLLGACRTSRNPYLSTIVLLAIHTGMRKGEILDLTWERIDLSTARITLEQTKSGKPRGVPINRAVYDALVALEPDPAQRQGRLFRTASGGRWGELRTAFATALRKAGIPGFRFHDLRHTAASHLIMRGASLKEVQELLGHSTLTMTLRYAHLSAQQLRGAVERLEGLTQPAGSAAPMAHELAQSPRTEGSETPNIR